MKKILGLDLGTGSIGWAVVNEAETADEQSSIVRLGVRVNPLTVDEQTNFEKGKPITTNADRTLKRSMRRSLQRYKLRREHLVSILKKEGWIDDQTLLSEQGNNSTFETYRLRAKAAAEPIALDQLARVLLMINKKRGYKSSRKAKGDDEGALVDGMEVARQMYDEGLTPGQMGCRLLEEGKRYLPDFYRSDLVAELDRIWTLQGQYYPEVLTTDFRRQISRQGKMGTQKIFLAKYQIYTADIKGKGLERQKQLYRLRCDALERKLEPEEMALVVAEVNGQANGSSGYLGAISDRSKELNFNHRTIGQQLMLQLDADPNKSLKNQPFYRQDYLDEFEQIWTVQAAAHPQLTDELKREIRDTVIFYQRRLKSQKWLVSDCEFEQGRKVCPKSSPLFQEFKTLQILNNLKVTNGEGSRLLTQEERDLLFNELKYKKELTKAEALKLLFAKPRGLDLNYQKLEGSRTMARLMEVCQQVVDMSGHGEYDFAKLPAAQSVEMVRQVFEGLGYAADWLDFDSAKKGADLDKEPLYRLWHLLYSYEGDNSATGDEKLVQHLMALLNMPREYAKLFAKATFEQDYGSLSAKALQNILPYMRQGREYSEACTLAGYRHSAQSLTREELDTRPLADRLELLPRNSLRNPVVEKILNQMVHVVNGVIAQYGRPDEVRIELARDLKKNAAERDAMSRQIGENTKVQEAVAKILRDDFGFANPSRNDIVRYRLWQELEGNGYKALYSNQYIPREKIFSKEVDIEHIIPQARLFDDSFSNKTLEYRAINIEKSNQTALDFVRAKYGDEGADQYRARVEALLKSGGIGQGKARKLLMAEADIPADFIDRDLRNTQYISREAQNMLRQVARTVTATTGSITDRLRQDWQLVDVMQELNWDKYDSRGLTRIIEGREGQKIRRIEGWTKRNDHRHHAMDALTIAFTKPSYIQYLNNLNARSDKSGAIYGIEKKELVRDHDGHLVFRSPIPIDQFRAEAKRQLEGILVSIKAKNKVATRNTNTTKTKHGSQHKVQLTPRDQLHKETVYGSSKALRTDLVAVGGKLTAQQIAQVQNAEYRNALRMRLEAFGGDAKKAFTGKNSLEKSPLWLDADHRRCVPDKVQIAWYELQYTIRKGVDKTLKLDKVLDLGVRRALQARLDQYGGDAAKAFANLDDDPIWLNREKGLCIKRVTTVESIHGEPLHTKHDKEGRPLLDADGHTQPADFVNLSNNHHVAIFRDAQGNLQEHLVSFYEATARATQLGLPVIDREYHKADGWQFLFTIKQNEYFVFPDPAHGFCPQDMDLTDPKNYPLISPHLYRVQKMSHKDYYFRHHLETKIEDVKELQGSIWLRITALNKLEGIVKVRVDHVGNIVQVGEY